MPRPAKCSPNAPRRVAERASRPLFFVALAVGAARILLIFSSAFRPDSDRAVVCLMARHAGSGDFSTFYWGKPYGGALL